jgi:IclR family transcriptional regulator, acetate operon repressor
MDVLRLFSPERRDLGVVETSELLDAPKSSVSRWLRAMAEAGFLVREPSSGRYRLSMDLAALGELARQATSLQRLARPLLEGLAAETGETSNLVILDRGAAVNVEVVQSPRPIKHVGILGRRLPLHATAAGKVLLAWLPAEDRSVLLAEPLKRYTEHTLCSRNAVEDELKRVRKVGTATAWKELEEDLAAASAPVRSHRGEVAAAITTSAPTSRVPEEALPELAARVRAAADALSAALGHRG